jgi:hypothetical protein
MLSQISGFKRWLILLCLTTADVAVLSARVGRIRITEGDPRDLTLYQGPSNLYRHGGKPLPSYILKAKPTRPADEAGTGLYGFVGSKKPVWNDEDEEAARFATDEAIQYYSLDCYEGQPCSQTIPIEADAKAEIGRPNLVTHPDPDVGNEIDGAGSQVPVLPEVTNIGLTHICNNKYL